MLQTKLGSFIEACANVAVGYTIAMLSQIVLFPLFGIHTTMSTHLWLGLWFTVISVVRSYLLRRFFNARLRDLAQQLADKLEAR